MATNLGKVGIVMKGAWSNSATYEELDAVTYNKNLYISKQAMPAGTLPTNTTYWQLAADTSDALQKSTYQTSTSSGSFTFAAETNKFYYVTLFRRTSTTDENEYCGFGIFTIYSNTLIWVLKTRMSAIDSATYDGDTGNVTMALKSYCTMTIMQ